MSHNRLMQIPWELHQATKRCSEDMIIKATGWLKDCHRKSPDWKTVFAIVAHYTTLALRQMETNRGEDATDYLSLALRWNSRTRNELIDVGQAYLAPLAAHELVKGSNCR